MLRLSSPSSTSLHNLYLLHSSGYFFSLPSLSSTLPKAYADIEVSFIPKSSKYLRSIPTYKRIKLLHLLTYILLLSNSLHNLLVLHHLHLQHWLLQLQYSVLRIFVHNCFWIHTSTALLLLDLLGPLWFSTVVPCLPYTILSWSGSARVDFSVKGPDIEGSVLLGIEL
jgi:hypothetical protein